MHRSARLVVSALLVLSLTGCSGEDDPTATESSASTSSSPATSSSGTQTPSAEPTPSATVPADEQVADPCALLDPPDYAALLAKKLASSFAEQITQYGTFMTCRTYLAVLTPLRFGFSLDPGAYDQAYAELAPRPDYDDTREDVDLGDRAFVADRPGDGVSVYAESYGVTFMVDLAVGTFGMDGVATGTAADVQAAAARMVEHGAGRMSDTAILLPESCPAVTDPVVTDLVGTVAWGRGGSNPDGISACGYAGEDGRELRASYTFMTPGAFDIEYGYPPSGSDVVVDPKPGVYKTWSRRSDGGYRYLAMYPDSEPQLELQLDFSGGPGPKAQVSRRFLAWANAYLTANEPSRK